MLERQIVIGTRGSLLARWQANLVESSLRHHHPGLATRQELIVTQGDRVLDVALSKVGGKGLFTKELDLALESGAIDLAVHSLKDVPTALPPGMTLAAVLPRADWQDAWVGPYSIADLPKGARVGTGSLRRAVQLRRLRPDVQILDLRGNVDTRLRKLDEGQYDAIILAVAGLRRLERAERIRETLPFIPAAGQGAIAIQIRENDTELATLLAPLHDEATAVAVRAERAWLARMEGGCQVPMGALATVSGDRLTLRAFAADPDGDGYLETSADGALSDPEALGRSVAETLLRDGAHAWCEADIGRDPGIA